MAPTKEPKATPPSLSLAGTSEYERRRLPRLSLASEQFRLELAGGAGKLFSVTDLSEGGMALRVLDEEDMAQFPVGRSVQGVLNVRHEKLKVRGRVRHVAGQVVGVEFEELGRDTSRALERFLDPRVLGADLKPIPVAEGGRRWFHGTSGTDLVVESNDAGKDVRRFTLYVLRSYVQCEQGAQAVTGRTRPGEEAVENHGVVRVETLLLEPDSKPDAGKLQVAKNLILGSNLDDGLRRALLALLP